MSCNGKRFVASLFGIHLSENIPVFQSLVPQRISNEIMAGKLLKFNPSTIMLKNNETCHFMDKAAIVVKKKERSYYSCKYDKSYKITKNLTMHSSNRLTNPVDQEWYEFTEGVVFVTNARIIFVALEDGFEKEIKNLTFVVPYNNAVALQFGNQTLNLIMPMPKLMVSVLNMVH